MATPVSFDPSTYNSTTLGSFTLGARYSYLGREFRYFKLTDAVNGANGMMAEWATTAGTNVTTVDRAGGSSLGRIPSCVLVGTVTAGNYYFGLVRGYHTAIKDAAGGVNAVGKKCMSHATTDGDAAPATAYTDCWIAICHVVSAAGVFGGEVYV